MAINPFEWQCSFCNQHQVVTDSTFAKSFKKLYLGKPRAGDVGVSFYAIRCANPSCNELTLTFSYVTAKVHNGDWVENAELQSWRLLPDSYAKPQPDYIPIALRDDYREACLIRDKSPKSAATLARRCLQGMIRDFCGISKSRLVDEINTLRERVEDGSAPKGVEPETVEAIDAIRGIGNIGAHMERDISLIVDVDPGEAQALIELIEMLFEEWYVARHVRDEKLTRVKMIAAEKAAAIQAGKAQMAQQKLATTTD
ncbi:MAG: DUF4145 domain-containing protein [Proteobacteria bacterium]|nr:DUF4145 domain-containing protein [Pseudomonadota bacterium]